MSVDVHHLELRGRHAQMSPRLMIEKPQMSHLANLYEPE